MDVKILLESHQRIMLDSAPLIYFIERHPSYVDLMKEVVNHISDTSRYFVFSSVITIVEVLTQPLRTSNRQLTAQYEQVLFHSYNLKIMEIDSNIARKAAELRALYQIKTPDALQIATCLENGGTLFVTNDKRLLKIKDVDILLLDDYL